MKGVQPVVLLILDGFGVAKDSPWNAITQANAPEIKTLLKDSVHSELLTHGEAVGLPEGIMGNSEVGHMNIGAGRVVWQELSRINKEIREGKFAKNPLLLKTIRQVRDHGKRLHLCGLLSDGGVHSHQEHLFALLDLCRQEGLKKVSIHAFLDGRDTPPQSAPVYLQRLEEEIQRIGVGSIASLSGRYYAMDRDKRWDRVELAYKTLFGKGPEFSGNKSGSAALAAIKASYADGKNDEFLLPVVIEPKNCIQEEDTVLFFNYRADRMRQIVAALGEEEFSGFNREVAVAGRKKTTVATVCFTQYDEHFHLPVVFEANSLSHLLGDVVADAGLKQFRIAETEKYAHVTFFFNGGREAALPGEERILIPSPRDVPTYDQKPAMSALEVTDKLCAAIRRKEYAFLVCNFANADMVGHTGIFSAAVQAVETLDKCVKQIRQAAAECGYELFISADHGNVEEMRDAGGVAHTQHTLNPVPLIYCSPQSLKEDKKHFSLKSGVLADIMPTLLTAMHLPIPKEVTGKNLLKKN